MTVRELIMKYFQEIAEMADLCRMMDRQVYEAWKRGIMEDMEQEPEVAKVMELFFPVMDVLVLEGAADN